MTPVQKYALKRVVATFIFIAGIFVVGATGVLKDFIADEESPPSNSQKPTAIAPEQPSVPGYKTWLTEMNGLWLLHIPGREEPSQARLHFSPAMVQLDAPSLGVGGSPTVLGIIGTDDETRSVTVSVKKAEYLSPEEWTIRQVWNDAHTSFHVLLIAGTTQVQMSFVRRFFDVELAQLSKAVGVHSASVLNPATPAKLVASNTQQASVAGWDNSVGDLNGVWVADNGIVRMYFTPQRLALQLDDAVVEPQIVAVDPETKALRFSLKAAPEEGTSVLDRVPSTDNPKGFDLSLKTSNGVELALRYGRALTAAEVAALGNGRAYEYPKPPKE